MRYSSGTLQHEHLQTRHQLCSGVPENVHCQSLPALSAMSTTHMSGLLVSASMARQDLETPEVQTICAVDMADGAGSVGSQTGAHTV